MRIGAGPHRQGRHESGQRPAVGRHAGIGVSGLGSRRDGALLSSPSRGRVGSGGRPYPWPMPGAKSPRVKSVTI